MTRLTRSRKVSKYTYQQVESAPVYPRTGWLTCDRADSMLRRYTTLSASSTNCSDPIPLTYSKNWVEVGMDKAKNTAYLKNYELVEGSDKIKTNKYRLDFDF